MFYVLHNDELGYIDNCPTFETRHEAVIEAAGKCRFHTVVETNEAEPCSPLKLRRVCLSCARCAATVSARKQLKRDLGIE